MAYKLEQKVGKKITVDELLGKKKDEEEKKQKTTAPAAKTEANTTGTGKKVGSSLLSTLLPNTTKLSMVSDENKNKSILGSSKANDILTYKKDRDALERITNGGINSNVYDPRGYANDVALLKKTGYASDSDYKLMNDTQLGMEKYRLQNERDKALEKESTYKEHKDELIAASDLQGQKETQLYKIAEEGLDDQGNIITKKPDDYELYRQDYHRMMYDAIYGVGKYDTIDPETQEENDALYDEMERYWDALDNGTLRDVAAEEEQKYFTEMDKAQGDFGSKKAEKGLKQIGKQEELNAKKKELMETAPDVDTTYDPSLVSTRKSTLPTDEGNKLFGEKYKPAEFPVGSEADQIYWYLNNRPEEGTREGDIYNNMQPAWFMNDEEAITFERWYLSGDKESAMAFYNTIKDSLEQITSDTKNEMDYRLAHGEYGAEYIPGQVAKRVITQPGAGLMGTAGIVAGIFGNEEAMNPNNRTFWGLTAQNQNIQAGRAESWADAMGETLDKIFPGRGRDVAKMLNSTAYSIADNMTARLIGMGIGGLAGDITGKLASGIIQGIMSSEAASNTTYNALLKKMDPTEAIIRGIASGTTEYVTEKFSTDRFFETLNRGGKGLKALAWDMAYNFAPEAQEEITGKIVESLCDDILSNIYDHKSEFRERMDAIMEKENCSDSEALGKALLEYADETLQEGTSGGLAGAAQGGGASIVANVRNNNLNAQIGQQAKSYNIVDDASAQDRSTGEAVNTVSIVNMAKNMGLGTESNELGTAAYNKIMSGKTLSDAEIGAMSRALLNDTNESVHGTIKNIFGAEAQQRLEQMGESTERSGAVADSVVNVMAGTYSAEDMLRIAQSEAAQQLIKDYKMNMSGLDTKKAEIETETKEKESIRETVAAMIAERPQVSAKNVSRVVADAETATKEEIAEAGGVKSGSAAEAVADGSVREIEGVETVQTDEGEQLQVKFTDGSSADIANVKAVGKGMAQVLRYAQMNAGLVSDEYANAMMKHVTKGDDASAMIAGAMKIRWDVVTGQKTTNSGLVTETAGALRTTAERELQEWNENRQKNYRQINPGKGTTTYNGVTYGTTAFTQEMKGLDKATRNEATVIAQIAKAAGLDVKLINDPQIKKQQGWYEGGTNGNGIVINLAGEYANGIRRSAVATVAHEVTHWLEGNSSGAYSTLRAFVLNSQTQNGMNVQQRLGNIIDTYAAEGVKLDMFDAVSELVAKSCEEVLTNERLVSKLRQQDPENFTYIFRAVREVVGRIRNALGLAKETSSIYAKSMREYADKLDALWFAAYEEAAKAKGTGEGTGTEQLSVQEDLDTEYAQAVENRDWRKAEAMLLEKAQNTEGITGYKAPHFYNGEHKEIAKMIKENYGDTIAKAVDEMAPMVPENAVLVPMPPHEGKVLEGTDTMILARAISEATGVPVVKALESDYHESRYKAKAEGNRNVNAQTMGFRQIAEIPEGSMPVYIDNMVGGGQTAMAAKNAIGRGITLAYAQSARGKSQGVKALTVTYDENGKLIPLSKRMDVNNKSWKYSVQDNENDYIADRESRQNRIINALKNIQNKKTFSAKEMINMARNADYNALVQYVHNEYEKKGKGITKNEVISFIQKDRATMRKNASEVVNAWKNLVETKGAVKYEVLDTKNAQKGYFKDLWRNIARVLLGNEKSIMVYNGDTLANIRIDTDTIKKSILYNQDNRIDNKYKDITELVLKKADVLLQDAIYIGSHMNYEHHNGNVHYLVSAVKYGNDIIPVVFAVQDAIDEKQAKQFSERAYVTEIMIPSTTISEEEIKEDGLRNARRQNVPASDLPQGPSYGASISDIIENVNSDRIREFNKDRLKGQKVQASIQENDEEYDDNGNVIPPSERFNSKKTDIRWSIQDESEGDIRYWMMSVKPETLQTEAERELLKHYQDVQTRLDLRNMQIGETKEKIRRMEAKGELNADEKKLLAKWKIQLENAQRIKKAAEEELGEIVGQEGYGRMMKRQARRFDDFMYGKTQQEVTEEVGNLQKISERINEEIEANKKRIAEIESKGVIGTLKKILGTTTADRTAAELKKEFHSSWTKGQIRNYLDPILIKLANGEDITNDVEELAGILVNSDERNVNEDLAALRGLTITLGKGAQQELKAKNSSLKEIRARLAGTGITVKYGDHSTLETDIEDLREEYPNMPDFGSDKDALENFVTWVEGMKQSAADEFYAERLAEAMAQVFAKVTATAKGIYIPTEARAQKQVMALIEYVKSLGAEAQAAAESMDRIAQDALEMWKGSGRAAGLANVLTNNIGEALEYYDRTAKMALAQAKVDRNTQIIDQLKSEAAQKIAKNNEEWRNLIERDRQAKEKAEDLRASRSRINTALKRTLNLLKNPKGTKNIPEHMQGLARELIGIFVDNDMSETRGTKITLADKEQLKDTKRLLDAWKAQDGEYDPMQLQGAEEAVQSVVAMDLMTIMNDLALLNEKTRGKNKLDTVTQRAEIMKEMSEAVGEIYSMIRAEGRINIRDRQIATEDQAYKVVQDTNGKQYKEWTGKAGRAIRTLHKAIVSGNMTPEYFFRTLGNEGLSELWDNYHKAENRNGLELKKAKDRLTEIAEKYGFDKWDMKQKITLPLESGDVELTLGQMMSLWATWKREQTLGPAMSEHLTKGGFYAEKDLRDGILGRTVMEKKAHRVTEADMQKVSAMLTDEQMQFIDDVVGFMSNDMSALGNEASMKAYGIKMYKEKYYFPFQMWDGVKSRKSNESGVNAGQDRAFHPSFSKSRMHGANNAIVIGDFMQTAAAHIAGMINYATMGLANENMQKVLNTQLNADAEENGFGGTKRNVQAILEEAYGKEAMQYFTELKNQLNGGAVRTTRSLGDKAISLFRKNAVAGSMSVALQQPLSYIRAAMMINPKYLAQAMNPATWKGSYQEMIAHSGVAVIKDMGRFDMNFGQSAREFLTPDGKQSTGRKIYEGVEEWTTKLPELMDRMTWTRMWSAVKAEQHELHPEMDVKSDKFLDLCGERFNDLMRRTQVYDSVLVKSSNMRSDHYWVKSLTSFMAEPTLTLNVLADSVRMAKNGEKGGMGMVGKAAGTFLLSAVLQAAVKGLMGSGRTPDEKKTWLENFLYRFWYNFQNEADPIQLVPGFSDVVTLMKEGKLNDDAMGAIGKIFSSSKTFANMLLGNEDILSHRNWEDSAAQLMQLFTGVPLKNIMRDGRAMWNWTIAKPYAQRDTNPNVLKYQMTDATMDADNLIGVVNKWLGDAGYDTSVSGYKKRVYEAMKAGNEEQQSGYIDYLLTGKGVKEEKSIWSGVKGYIKEDYENGKIEREEAEKLMKKADPAIKDKDLMKALDEIDYEKETGEEIENYSNYTKIKKAIEEGDDETVKEEKKYLIKNGYKESDVNEEIGKKIKDLYVYGNISRTEAEKLYAKYCGLNKDDAWWKVDRIEYQRQTKAEKAPSGYYYRLTDAVDANKSSEIKTAVSELLAHGVTKDKIKGKLSDWKKAYLAAKGNDKVRIKNALIIAYKAIGISEEEANKIINKWK